MARAAGTTQRWDRRRIGQWQPRDPPYSFRDFVLTRIIRSNHAEARGPKQIRILHTGQGQQGVSEAFRGEFNQKVDSKARVSIPAPFRRVLEAGDPAFDGSRPKFVMVYGGGAARQFVECYTIEQMRRLEAQIREIPIGTKRRKALERNFITLTHVVEVDDDGRIVLPPKVREKIGLSPDTLKDGSEAVFAGSLETFQIWRRDDYDAEMAEQEDDDLDLSPGEDMLALLTKTTGE